MALNHPPQVAQDAEKQRLQDDGDEVDDIKENEFYLSRLDAVTYSVVIPLDMCAQGWATLQPMCFCVVRR